MKKLFFYFLTSLTGTAFAQWNANTASNTPVAIAIKSQSNLHSVTDRNNGCVIVWDDNRNNATNSSDIYTQRMYKNGVAKWTIDGKAICTFTGTQQSASIADAEDGSSIIAWEDSRSGNYDIYAQKIDSSGNLLWAVNGVSVCSKTTNQKNPKVISDKAGGAIIVWEDSLNFYWDVTAQRISSVGVVMWTANGVNICNAANNQINPKMDIDGSGGAIITWQDKRNAFDYDIYAQRVDANGAVQWTANGLVICNSLNAQNGARIEPDGSNGAFIAWVDKRSASNTDIYAQRINSSGAVQWLANGVVVCNAANNQSALDIKYIGAAGLMLTWKDSRINTETIYAQLINMTGVNQMGTNGVAISNSLKSLNPNIVSDGLGGGIIAWEDSVGTAWNITSQKINSSGVVQWAFGGAAVSTATDNQNEVSHVSDGNGGAIYVWEDHRNGTEDDVFAQHLYADGMTVIGIFENSDKEKLKATCYPNPVSDVSVIKVLNNLLDWELKIVDVNGKLIYHSKLNGSEEFLIRDLNLRSGTYFYEARTGENSVSKGGRFVVLN